MIYPFFSILEIKIIRKKSLFSIDNGVQEQPCSNTAGMGYTVATLTESEFSVFNENL